MMRPFFEKEENIARLKDSLESWEGTPYRHFCRVKQRGIDCATFAASIYLEVGILEKLNYSYYPRDWHIHTNKEIFLESLQYHIDNHLNKKYIANKIEMSINPLYVGDWLIFALNSKICNHSGIYIGNGRMVHAIQKRGVILDKLKTWKPFLKRNYRVFIND